MFLRCKLERSLTWLKTRLQWDQEGLQVLKVANLSENMQKKQSAETHREKGATLLQCQLPSLLHPELQCPERESKFSKYECVQRFINKDVLHSTVYNSVELEVP